MKIQVLGSSCPNCKKFYDLVRQVALDLRISEPVDYVNDLKEVIKIGIMTTPALLVNGEVVLTGRYHSREVIRRAFLNLIEGETK